MRYLLTACAAVLVCGVIAQEKGKITVYYDSMDPASKCFFRTQLEPLMRKSPDAGVEVVNVPFDKEKAKIAVFYDYMDPDSNCFFRTQMEPLLRYYDGADVGFVLKDKTKIQLEPEMQTKLLNDGFDNILVPYDKTKGNITLYYDSSDPDSQCFFQTQLKPAEPVVPEGYESDIYKKLPDDGFDIVLVPYGKAKEVSTYNDDNENFTSLQGLDPYYSNKIHACILYRHIIPKKKKVDLIFCLMKQDDPLEGLLTCTENYKRQMHYLVKLNNCALGNLGDELIAKMETKTSLIQNPLNVVPTVYIIPGSDLLNDRLHKSAVTNLDVCLSAWENYPLPPACRENICPDYHVPASPVQRVHKHLRGHYVDYPFNFGKPKKE